MPVETIVAKIITIFIRTMLLTIVPEQCCSAMITICNNLINFYMCVCLIKGLEFNSGHENHWPWMSYVFAAVPLKYVEIYGQ